ncbi:hypothetical protein L596_010700 [Steinernema carpocapsae]|uniref:Uncharacterized protein n=1 Tax=Steinernema carpocapsae TaxID=34508 RepID=A0A4U5PJE1_STECR|nr:hypothetical protein L596_010700 [Steinernema carpocapsae]
MQFLPIAFLLATFAFPVSSEEPMPELLDALIDFKDAFQETFTDEATTKAPETNETGKKKHSFTKLLESGFNLFNAVAEIFNEDNQEPSGVEPTKPVTLSRTTKKPSSPEVSAPVPSPVKPSPIFPVKPTSLTPEKSPPAPKDITVYMNPVTISLAIGIPIVLAVSVAVFLVACVIKETRKRMYIVRAAEEGNIVQPVPSIADTV